ncbi:YdcF family protein [Bacillus sp. 123MFChir2]|uniref:YdcF family protein n=1 Tax=Bacillus sp. 123MFChir2 TaxID=1169144 RepID=UPI00035C2FCA|nr:YdcF family protein [Bacillus sp. 123MFChir2]
MFLEIITFILLIIFLFFYLRDPRSLLIGFLFNLFFCSFLILFVYLGFSSSNIKFQYIAVIPLLIIGFMLTFGIFALMIGLFLNARILMRRERLRFSNCLVLLAGLSILFSIIVFLLFEPTQLLTRDFGIIPFGVFFIIVYFLFHLSNFLTAYFLYQFNRPKPNQDFIIVLGSGLINDKVPPLLASRINKAIDFYWKQAAVSFPPIIIFSGGQGPDENISEAEAMQTYAVEKGIPIEHTIKEDRSVNTYQNMLFSKQIMDSRKEGKYESIFTTNNFHLFRAGLYAKKAGLNSHGIGSETAFYYWPNAMIREYIAIVVMGRKLHTKVVAATLGFPLLLTAIYYLFF